MINKKIVYYTIVRKDIIPICDDYSKRDETKKSRYVLKWILDYLNIKYQDISVLKYGKPYFKDLDICFNYSHSKSYIACAVSSYNVGIDIEDCDRKISDRVSKKYLDGEKNNEKKLEKWVRKEAYSKLVGLGLLIGFNNLNLNNICDRNIFIKTKDYVCSIYSGCDDVVFKEVKFR